MTLTDIRRIFEKRKYNLINALENGKDEIELAKQHQIYGAIREIQNILKIIDYHQEQDSKNNFEFRLSQEEDNSILQKITFKLKKNVNKKTLQTQKIN